MDCLSKYKNTTTLYNLLVNEKNMETTIRDYYDQKQIQHLETTVALELLEWHDWTESIPSKEQTNNLIYNSNNEYIWSVSSSHRSVFEDLIRKQAKSIADQIKDIDNKEYAHESLHDLHALLSDHQWKLDKSLQIHYDRYMKKLYYVDNNQRIEQQEQVNAWLLERVTAYSEKWKSKAVNWSSPQQRSQLAHWLTWTFATVPRNMLLSIVKKDSLEQNSQYDLEKQFIQYWVDDVCKISLSIRYQLWYRYSTHKSLIKETSQEELLNAVRLFKEIKSTAKPLEVTWVPNSWKIEYCTAHPFEGNILVYAHWVKEWIETQTISMYDSIIDLQRWQQKVVDQNNQKKEVLNAVYFDLEKLDTRFEDKETIPSLEEVTSVLSPLLKQTNKFVQEIKDNSLPLYWKRIHHRWNAQAIVQWIKNRIEKRIIDLNAKWWKIQEKVDALQRKNNQMFNRWSETYTKIRQEKNTDWAIEHFEKNKHLFLAKPYSKFADQFEILIKNNDMNKEIKTDILISLHSIQYRLQIVKDLFKKQQYDKARSYLYDIKNPTYGYLSSTYESVLTDDIYMYEILDVFKWLYKSIWGIPQHQDDDFEDLVTFEITIALSKIDVIINRLLQNKNKITNVA